MQVLAEGVKPGDLSAFAGGQRQCGAGCEQRRRSATCHSSGAVGRERDACELARCCLLAQFGKLGCVTLTGRFGDLHRLTNIDGGTLTVSAAHAQSAGRAQL